MTTPERWSHSEGEPPLTVTVFERRPGGPLYVRIPDKTYAGGYRRESLKHTDREKAKIHAKRQALKFAEGIEDQRRGRTTLARLFAAYKRHRSPKKSASERKADDRRIEMWTRILGGERDPLSITLGEWEAFVDDRLSGAIDARGNRVPERKRRPVRTRTIERDLVFLNAVMNWGGKWRTREGRYLLPENPVRGFEIPREKNPRRPIATQDRYEKTRAKTDEVTMRVTWGEEPEAVRSHVSEILDLANATGRRLSAIRCLRHSDLLFDRGPHGSIRWRAETDKTDREAIVPMTPEARAAVERTRRRLPGVGDAPLFPAPGDPTEPVSRHLCDKWLREAESKAGLEPLEGKLWHAYRAKFATELLDQPERVVKKLGGWKDSRTLDIYTQLGEDAMLRALEGRRELRDKRIGRQSE